MQENAGRCRGEEGVIQSLKVRNTSEMVPHSHFAALGIHSHEEMFIESFQYPHKRTGSGSSNWAISKQVSEKSQL
jgi:hypothetical protein